MKPSTVSFSIEEKPKNAAGDKFGPDYAGQFVCRVPTLDEAWGTLGIRVTARAQRDGATDATTIGLPNYLWVQARVWLDTLSVSVPAWYEPVRKDEAENDDELGNAVIVAYAALQELLDARKKKPALTSVVPSPTILPRAATS